MLNYVQLLAADITKLKNRKAREYTQDQRF
jgi:hypothetical protein